MSITYGFVHSREHLTYYMNKKLLQYRERTHKRLYFKNEKFSLQREFLLRIANISKI